MKALLKQIAGGIEKLKPGYPQLAEFRASDYDDADEILYAYRSKPNTQVRAGWRVGFPQPQKGGVVIWIRVLREGVVTQDAFFPAARVGDYQVPVYVFDGPSTEPLSSPIEMLLRALGWHQDAPQDTR